MEPPIDRRCTPRPQVIVVADDHDGLRHLWHAWLSMFRFDGVEARTGAEALAILMVTAHTSAEHRRAAPEAGCTAFLAKPVDPHELLAQLRRVLARP